MSGWGIQDSNATGAMGKYDGTNYGFEIKVPVGWYSSTYGGAVTDDGTGAQAVIGAVFTSVGSLGGVGEVKDTLNDGASKTLVSFTSTVDAQSQFFTSDITKIVFTTSAQTLTTGQVSSVMTIQTQDGTGTPQNVSSNTTINLTSTSGTGKFSASASPWSDTTSVTIPNGGNSASFYYKDTTAGTPTITAAESPSQGWTDATQQESIGATLESYSDPGYTTVCDNFQNYATEHTVYMYGTNFLASHSYKVAYYDDGNDKRATDTQSSDGSGNLSSHHTFVAGTDVAGTWHVIACDATQDPPATYDANWASTLTADGFNVQASAIPEFPTFAAFIVSLSLCAGVYLWMRRRGAPVRT